MFGNSLLKTGLAIVLSAGVTYGASDPASRLNDVKELFTQYGVDAFKIMNGHDLGGTNSNARGKGDLMNGEADILGMLNPGDSNSFIFCVADGKWTVYPPEPMKVGTDAMSITDANGQLLIPRLIEALRKSPDGKASRIPYSTKTPYGTLEKREATVWNSYNLLSRKNDTGQKFFCGTSTKVN